MKRFALLVLSSAMAMAAATPASAAIIISYSVNGGAITQLATDAATPGSATFNGTSGGYTFQVSGTGRPLTLSDFNLLTQSVNIKSTGGAATLNVFITDTNLPQINGGTLMSSFTTNSPVNNTSVISSLISTSNTPNVGTVLQSATFNTPGIGNGMFDGLNTVTAAGPFALTARYDITFGAGGGEFNGTANIRAVPEPATWGMMIAGFGLVGGVMRRRKTSVAFA